LWFWFVPFVTLLASQTLAALVARARGKGLQIGLVVDEAHIGLDKSSEFGKFAGWLPADYLLIHGHPQGPTSDGLPCPRGLQRAGALFCHVTLCSGLPTVVVQIHQANPAHAS
jgi:hypothetical protein